MEEKKCPKCGAPCNIGVIMDEIPRVVDADTHVFYVYKPPAGAVWVRASELNTLVPVWRPYRKPCMEDEGEYDYGEIYITEDEGRIYLDVDNECTYEHQSDERWKDYEILDESGTAAPEWDSIRLIGRVKERFKELEEKQHDWRSFYCAWFEGRVDMLQQIKGRGRLSQEQADFIREANNRDLGGVAIPERTWGENEYSDLSLATPEQKAETINGLVLVTAREVLKTFLAFGLKTHIECTVVNDPTKEEFDFIFRKKGTAAGREEDAVEFAEWAGWDWRRVEGKSLWENQKTLEVMKTAQLYKLFKQKKEK